MLSPRLWRGKTIGRAATLAASSLRHSNSRHLTQGQPGPTAMTSTGQLMMSSRQFMTSSCTKSSGSGSKLPKPPSPGKLRGVIFDVGGVLLPSPFPSITHLEEELHLPKASIGRAILLSGQDGAFAKLERGELCTDDPAFWSQFKADYERHNQGVKGSVDGRQFLEALAQAFTISFLPAAVEAIRCLRAEGIRTAVLTNNFKTRAGETGLAFPKDLFDVVSFGF